MTGEQQPVIINAALTGMVPTRADNAALPTTPEEIAADARRCFDAGARVVHIHARDDRGDPTSSQQRYAETIAAVRNAAPDLIVSGSTSGRVHGQFAQRAAVLRLPGECRPDLASLTLGSMNFPRQASVSDPDMIRSLAAAMDEHGIRPELELFEVGMADFAVYLVKRGVVRPPLYANILLGSLGTLSATPENLLAVTRSLPENTVWSATGIGRFQFRINTLALAIGGHVRVGLEDSLFYDVEKTRPASNPGLVERVARVARAMERDVATPEQTRALLGLDPR